MISKWWALPTLQLLFTIHYQLISIDNLALAVVPAVQN